MTIVRSLAAFVLLVALTGCAGSSKHAVPAAPTTTTAASTTTLPTAHNIPATGIGSQSHRCTREKIAIVDTAVEAYRAQHKDPKAAPTLAQLVQAQLLTAVPEGVTLEYADGQPSITASC